jgi:sterol desaturase/sphingolipid hydroxylase (fatty acid hydroxylase superfamily)
MGMFEALLSVFVIIIVFSIPFAVFAFVRYLRYKETIALAERGLLRPERRRRNQDTLRWGIVIMMLGLGLLCGLWPLGFMASSSEVAIEGPASGPVVGESGVSSSTLPFGISPWMVLGTLPFFFGLSLIIIYWVNKREDAEVSDEEAIPRHKQVELGKEET